jgi:exosome complex exonuclease DIS3/RRP44
MLQTKTILRKTNRGGFIPITREVYLRDDIPCGYPGCTACQQHLHAIGDPQRRLLSAEPRSTRLFAQPHYLLIDASVAQHQVCRVSLFHRFMRHFNGRLMSWSTRPCKM